MRPSMPGSISTNAPNEVRLRTLPLRRVPTGYFCGYSGAAVRLALIRIAERAPMPPCDKLEFNEDALYLAV